ncbi:MAG TPA: hypothetical protein VK797_02000 [Tepidisphaeraceae bacterium]|jgi:hypothetical protein|nr:hypothetical protein [Tepidisphaeraceae bacterium]
MPQRKTSLADDVLNAHEKLFAERLAQKLVALVEEEWIAAGGAHVIRPQAKAAALRLAVAGVSKLPNRKPS